MRCKPSSRVSHDSHSWGFKICIQHCETNDKIMSWQRCLFLRPLRLIPRALSNRNSSRRGRSRGLRWVEEEDSWPQRAFSYFLLNSCRFSPSRSLSIPLFARVTQEPVTSLLRSASHRHSSVSVSRVSGGCHGAFLVPALLTGVNSSRFLSTALC